MSRKCELTGKKAMSGNNVSHAKNRTKRKFLPNLNNVTLTSECLGRDFQLRISASALRTVNKLGGLDPFLKKSTEGVFQPIQGCRLQICSHFAPKFQFC